MSTAPEPERDLVPADENFPAALACQSRNKTTAILPPLTTIHRRGCGTRLPRLRKRRRRAHDLIVPALSWVCVRIPEITTSPSSKPGKLRLFYTGANTASTSQQWSMVKEGALPRIARPSPAIPTGERLDARLRHFGGFWCEGDLSAIIGFKRCAADRYAGVVLTLSKSD
jgi:hypothetical protein